MATILNAAGMRLYRHPSIQTGRPYTFEVDDDGVLWEGQSDALYRHDSRTGEARKITVPAMAGLQALSVLCFDRRVLIVHGECGHCTVFDPISGETRALPLPGLMPIVWYGTHTAGKLLLYDRSGDGGVLVLDAVDAPIRKVVNTFGSGDLPAGTPLPDGRVLSVLSDPVRLLFFDPFEERFIEQIDSPYSEAGVSGRFVHDEVLYCADSAAGRILPFHLREKRWLPPIPTPDHGRTYGFIGGGFGLGSVGYFCLSTYRFRSRIDPATGKLVLPEGWDVGVDNLRPRFLDRFLAFDAESQTFSYLTVPAQPDGVPLICYSFVRRGQVFITGYVIPFDDDRNPSDKPGDWLVWQSDAPT